MLSDRFGRKRMLLISAIVFATAPFLYPLANGLWQLAAIRFYHGLATAIFVPVAMAMVSDLFHAERGEKIGWFSTSTLAGRFIAPLVGGSVLGALVMNPSLSFRVVYLICGAAGLLALIFTVVIPDPGDGTAKKREWSETFEALRSVISNRVILTTSAVEAAILFAYGAFETFLPIYSKSVGLSTYEVGIFLSAQIITLALTKPAMGRLSDRRGRKPQIFTGALAGAVCMGCLPLFASFLPLLALSILFGFSLSIVTSATSAFIADSSCRETHGSAMGMLGSIMDIGHTTGPLVSGILAAHFGFTFSFLGAMFLLVVIAFGFRLTVKDLQCS
jgi:MFS family permease